MPDASADLPSLSATCPTTINDPPEKAAINGNHDATRPFASFSDAQVRPASKPLTPKSREAAVRAAKKEIAEKVREDWTWPTTSPHMQPHLDCTGDDIAWRERDSDSEYSPPSPMVNADPYRFDSPDSVAQPVLSKKRKRQQRLEEEMNWNDGLRTFVERRDAWAGAKPQSLPHQPDVPHLTSPYPTHQKTTNCISSPPTPPPSTNHPAPQSRQPPLSPPQPQPQPQPQQPPLLPLPPPILPPENPIRASIKPDTYPSIYDKIIIRGQSPSIPINLKDVVHALVAGWKKDGEWPPKSEAGPQGEELVLGLGDVSARREAQRLARRSVGRVKRVLGLGRGGDEVGREE